MVGEDRAENKISGKSTVSEQPKPKGTIELYDSGECYRTLLMEALTIRCRDTGYDEYLSAAISGKRPWETTVMQVQGDDDYEIVTTKDSDGNPVHMQGHTYWQGKYNEVARKLATLTTYQNDELTRARAQIKDLVAEVKDLKEKLKAKETDVTPVYGKIDPATDECYVAPTNTAADFIEAVAEVVE